MDVWIQEWDNTADCEKSITVWYSETEALRNTCDQIEDEIVNNWDCAEGTSEEDYADRINACIKKQDYRTAVELWNQYQGDCRPDYSCYWNIYSEEVRGNGGGIVATKSTSVSGYKSSVPGATCRGPCKDFNEYAYADNPDGTYMCRQCSMFHSIFGTNT